MKKYISEKEFSDRLVAVSGVNCECVVGVGRSGAVAAVYASHALHIPFMPTIESIPSHMSEVLLIDTAQLTGKTMRKAQRKLERNGKKVTPVTLFYEEKTHHIFWYEAGYEVTE